MRGERLANQSAGLTHDEEGAPRPKARAPNTKATRKSPTWTLHLRFIEHPSSPRHRRFNWTAASSAQRWHSLPTITILPSAPRPTSTPPPPPKQWRHQHPTRPFPVDRTPPASVARTIRAPLATRPTTRSKHRMRRPHPRRIREVMEAARHSSKKRRSGWNGSGVSGRRGRGEKRRRGVCWRR